jgi:hypothetical protein
MADVAYPLVPWTPPDAEPLTHSGAAANDRDAAPDALHRLRAELAQARVEAADWKWRAGHYERLFHDAQAKAAAHVAKLQAEIAAP